MCTVHSVTATIEVISRETSSFRVRCNSTGGRVLNISVTGPDFNSELTNIQAVGTQTWIGNDSYTGTTGTLTKGVLSSYTAVQHQMECHLSLAGQD